MNQQRIPDTLRLVNIPIPMLEPIVWQVLMASRNKQMAKTSNGGYIVGKGIRTGSCVPNGVKHFADEQSARAEFGNGDL
jgi:hypothetical protein